MMLVPGVAFLAKGVGKHREKLTSFEMALRDAGIAQFNLVDVSSIFPPNCRLVSPEEGLKMLSPGQVVFCVKARAETNEAHRLVAASCGLAIPKDRSHHGYISEHHACGQTGNEAGEYSEDLAASMLATILGIRFDPDRAWNERKQEWKVSGEIWKTMNVTQSALGNKNGLWTTVTACVMFVLNGA